ncbi:sugar transferase [Euhalothece natronophila Z-M001]|uniref:Sugar transferase n=1 Tax=Euhalothece natronophila Z-M001 TaxID=522448 RepID=A0A5B8NNB4_9CHRO|nr:sugar transferase [Euhalothece natronophila]QDZ40732.1 sugar transferase [Euhalothece natronophila Z-M001]
MDEIVSNQNRRWGKTTDIRAPEKLKLSKLLEWSWSRILALLISDLLAIAIAWQFARYFNQFYSPIPSQLVWWTWLGIPSPFWLFFAVTILCFTQAGLYSSSTEWKNYWKVGQITTLIYLGTLVLSYFYDPQLNPPRSLFVTAWFSSVFLLVGLRLITTLILKQCQATTSPTPIFLIADSQARNRLSQSIPQRSPYQIIGVADTSSINKPETFKAIIKTNPKEVLVADLPESELASRLYWKLRRRGIALRLIPSSRETLYRRGVPEIFAGIPTLRVEPPTMGGWEYRLKRYLDIIGASLGLIMLSPLFISCAIAIYLSSPGNPFFRQKRVGLHGKTFYMWKFRTMVPNAEALQPQLEQQNQTDGVLFKVQDDPRIIPIGKFLRRTSIDELPQLFNVLSGEMSLVGPRPLPLRDVKKFNSWHHTRHNVVPGITGLWQISGRSDLEEFNDIARLDLYYIDNWSINLDLEILVETFRIVLFAKGAY